MDIPRLEALNWRVRKIDDRLEKLAEQIEFDAKRLDEGRLEREHTIIERRVLVEEIERVRSQP